MRPRGGRRVAQFGTLLAVPPRGDERFAFLGLAGGVGLRPVAGIGDGGTEDRVLAHHRLDHRLGEVEHRHQLSHVIGFSRHLGLPGHEAEHHTIERGAQGLQKIEEQRRAVGAVVVEEAGCGVEADARGLDTDNSAYRGHADEKTVLV